MQAALWAAFAFAQAEPGAAPSLALLVLWEPDMLPVIDCLHKDLALQ
jgi:hypothetical protein